MPHRGIESTGLTLVGFLVILDIVRIRTRGGREAWLCLRVLRTGDSTRGRAAEGSRRAPVSSLGVSSWVRLALRCTPGVCGRDFPARWRVFPLAHRKQSHRRDGGAIFTFGAGGTLAFVANAVYLFYWVYDLAALLARGARRRAGGMSSTCIAMFLTSSDIPRDRPLEETSNLGGAPDVAS